MRRSGNETRAVLPLIESTCYRAHTLPFDDLVRRANCRLLVWSSSRLCRNASMRGYIACRLHKRFENVPIEGCLTEADRR